jgi:hypothetical protein
MSPELRAEALRDLVELRTPIDDAAAVLARFGWDSEDEPVTLTRADALRVLRGYLNGRLTNEDVRRWAEALEGREDLGRETGFEKLLTEFLFELATPELAGPLTPELAQHWTAVFSGQNT